MKTGTRLEGLGKAASLAAAIIGLAVSTVPIAGLNLLCGSCDNVASPQHVTAAIAADEDAARETAAPSPWDAPLDELAVGEWPMVAANPQRTSWTSEEVRGRLDPIWYRVLEPYIPPKVQIIAANGLLYISTARGLYALYAETGQTAWIYPTELPLGNSPTIFNGVAYVGGYDHKIHAINAETGRGIWAFEAGAGFETNPLVLDVAGHTYIYAGNRDGAMYAIEDTGSMPDLLWKYVTDGPVLFSAAYRDNVIYSASNDSHAYALNAQTGDLVWKSAKLPGAGFQTWWPVLHQDASSGADVVILAGSSNYRFFLNPGYGFDLQGRETDDIFPNREFEPRGTPVGERNADGTLDATRALQYFEAKPWRRTYVVLDRATGQETTFDFDGDGKSEYAPILWHGTHSGSRYPPVIGSDGVIYQSNTYMSDEWIPAGQVSGWVFGDPSISTPSSRWIAMDEPLAYSAGGNLIYWNQCNDRSAGAFDISIPNTRYPPSSPDSNREWVYHSYDLTSRIPEYNLLYEGVSATDYTINNLFRGPDASRNGVYGQHGHQNPPIPYGGTVYMHRSNAVIAWGDFDGAPTSLPMAQTVTSPDPNVTVSGYELRQRLADEVRKMVEAGHLRPGYRGTGLFDISTRNQYGDSLLDYWHDPSDTLYTLVLSLPYLPVDLQGEVRDYLQVEYAAYPPYLYTHVGWRDGTPREPFDLPQEAQVDLVNHPASVSGYGYDGWTWPPQMFYALWKYADEFGDAKTIFDASHSKLESPPSDAYLIEYPYVHNAYIAGYTGYLELEALAGYAESTNVKTELNRLLSLRATAFSKDTPYTDGRSARSLSVARNFIYLVPELGQYLHDTVYTQVQEAVDEYQVVAPYWFVADYDVTTGEGANQHFYDYHALFQAKALILQESGDELPKYLDVPTVQVGDLYYIQNLIAILQAGVPSGLKKAGTPSVAAQGGTLTYTLSFIDVTGSLAITDTLPAGVSAPVILDLVGTEQMPVYDAGTRQLTWGDGPLTGQEIVISYQVTVLTDQPATLKNVAVLSGEDGVSSIAIATVLVNMHHCFLPLVIRDG